MIESRWLFGAESLGPRAVSHASVPVGFLVDDVLRVFVSSRDEHGQSLPYFVDLDRETLAVRNASDGPLLELGPIGSFDEHGIMPSSAVLGPDGRVRLHYVGWNRSTGSVPYRVSIGCAISDDATNFERISTGPALDRNPSDPIFVTTPHVRVNDQWSMLYSTASRWEEIDGRLEPFYHLANATSLDGQHWVPEGPIALPLRADAVTRPTTVELGDCTILGFCHRRAGGYRTDRESSYRIGLARLEGQEATLLSADVKPAETDWASVMQCYPSFVKIDERILMLYNGNGFGRTGVGAAWVENDHFELSR